MNLYIYHHLGLGDHFDCNGIVRHLASNYDYESIGIFAKSSYSEMVRYMYRDDSRIHIIEVDKEKLGYQNERRGVQNFLLENPGHHLLVIGHENYVHEDDKNCWEIFYKQLDLPLETRYNQFHLERDKDAEDKLFEELTNNEPYIFIHEDPSRGYTLDRSHIKNNKIKIVENDVSKNIFHFIKIIENAEEIHCMESSFKTLIDIYAKQENLFFHNFRNHPLGTQSNKNWKVVEY